jgi:periplasmic divalent cation tolerance protein
MFTMTDLIEVTTTCACQATARQLADQLVQAGLAACVQITGPIESVYRWQGEIQRQAEWSCKIKSLRSQTESLIAFISQHHAYEVPEILIHQVVAANTAYQQWVHGEVVSPANRESET